MSFLPLCFLLGLARDHIAEEETSHAKLWLRLPGQALTLFYILALEETGTSNEEPGHHGQCCALLGVSFQGNPDTTVMQ